MWKEDPNKYDPEDPFQAYLNGWGMAIFLIVFGFVDVYLSFFK
jgi:hypothetical protein